MSAESGLAWGEAEVTLGCRPESKRSIHQRIKWGPRAQGGPFKRNHLVNRVGGEEAVFRAREDPRGSKTT